MAFLVLGHIGGEVLAVLLPSVSKSLNVRSVGDMASIYSGLAKRMSIYAAPCLPSILCPLTPLGMDPLGKRPQNLLEVLIDNDIISFE